MTKQPTRADGWRRHLVFNGRETEHGMAVEKEFEALRARNRLALHVIEYKLDTLEDSFYPANTLGLLKHNEAVLAEQPVRQVEKKDLAVLSMSLMPSPQSGKSIIPYVNHMHLGKEMAYLFNLDETLRMPARVLRAFEFSSNTGDDPFNKSFKLNSFCDSKELGDFYEPYTQIPGPRYVHEEALINAVLRNVALSGKQQDILGAHYDRSHASEECSYNELLVAAAPRHVPGIVIPLRDHSQYSSDTTPEKVEAVSQFAGALAGIEHARNGMELPVMLYPVYGKVRGRPIYVAQGEEECRLAAFEAVRKLARIHKNEVDAINYPLRAHGKRLLGVDVYDSAQAGWKDLDTSSRKRG